MRSKTGIILAAVLFLSPSLLCGAQNLKAVRAGEITRADGIKEYVIPSTTIVIDLTVKHESIKTGPYARYSQKYLGVIAPLADKEIYSIESAEISWQDTGELSSMPGPVSGSSSYLVSHIEPGRDFARVLPDKTSMVNKNPEDAARDAAQTIYNLRKRKAELVMGDIGEHVYGEGLSAALERMDKIENEYLELFLGKQMISTYTVRFYVTPDRENTSYVFCRFSESKGIVPAEDLGAGPVVLDLRPEEAAQAAYPATGKPKKNKDAVEYIVADSVVCRVVEGKREVGRRTVPVYQFGIATMIE